MCGAEQGWVTGWIISIRTKIWKKIIASIDWFQLDQTAINVIAWSHWEGRKKDISLSDPRRMSGVQTQNACMIGMAVRRSTNASLSPFCYDFRNCLKGSSHCSGDHCSDNHYSDDHISDDHSSDDHCCGDLCADNHCYSDNHCSDDHRSDDHSSDDHCCGDHCADNHCSDNHCSDDHWSLNNEAFLSICLFSTFFKIVNIFCI